MGKIKTNKIIAVILTFFVMFSMAGFAQNTCNVNAKVKEPPIPTIKSCRILYVKNAVIAKKNRINKKYIGQIRVIVKTKNAELVTGNIFDIGGGMAYNASKVYKTTGSKTFYIKPLKNLVVGKNYSAQITVYSKKYYKEKYPNRKINHLEKIITW